MKALFLSLATLFPLASFAAVEPVAERPPIPEVMTNEKARYTKVVVTNLYSDRISFQHDDGVTTVSLSEFDDTNLDRLIPGYIARKQQAAAEEAAQRQREEKVRMAEEEQRLAETKRRPESEKAEAMRQAQAAKEEAATAATLPQPNRSVFTAWTASSNGYTWNAAPESAKQRLCRALASNSRHGNSAAFFYDAFSTFYDSANPRILETSLNDMSALAEAASTTLRRNKRNY